MKKFTLLFVVAFMAILILGDTAFGQISFRAAASNTASASASTIVTKPAGVLQNDVMIAVVAAQGTTADATAPAGWTKIDGADLAGGTDRNGTVFYKVAGAAEAANYTFTAGAGGTRISASISAFYNVDVSGATPFDVAPGTIQVNGSSTTVAAASITTVNANAAVVMCAMSAGKTGTHSAWVATNPASLTEVSDAAEGDGNDGTSVGSAWALRATAGATGNGSSTLSAAERNGGILLALKPIIAASATLSPSATQNIAVGGSVNFTALANNYGGTGNYTFTWTAVGATGLGTNPVNQASNSNTKTLTYAVAGTYTVSVSIARSGASTLVTNTTTVNVLTAPASPGLWATSSSGTQVSTFSVNSGVYFAGPTNAFAPTFPGSTTGGTSTAALARTDKPTLVNGYFYWLPNTSGNNGVVEVFGADAAGGSQTRIGSLDLNGGTTTSLGFVRLGAGPDGTLYILAGDNSTVFLAKMKPNGVTVNGSLPAADQLVVVDASVTLSGGAASTFQNGDICLAGDGNLVALANDGSGLTQIFVGTPNGSSTTLTKKFDILDENSAAFSGSVNGVAFDLQGSLYVSAADGLYYINKNTVNGPAATISIAQVWSGTGLQDLASNFFPTTIITPVKLGTFEVSKSGNDALLRWTTLTETNSDHFEIERSIDGINFTAVGTKQAAGTTVDARSYQYADPIAGASIIYYRLRTVDLDARSSLSKIVVLRLNGAAVTGFKVYPNPFTSDLKIQINSEKETTASLRINNALGQPVINRKITLQTGENIVVLSAELATLNKGMYVMEIITDDAKMTEKIMKR